MHQPIEMVEYTINKNHQNDEWMLHDIDISNLANQWTKNSKKALTFSSKEEAEELIRQYDLHNTYVGEVITK